MLKKQKANEKNYLHEVIADQKKRGTPQMTRDNMKQYIKCMLDLEKTMYTYGRSLSKLENQIK